MSSLDLATRPSWLPASAWPWPVYSVATPAGRVAVTDAGTGPTLLLVHTGTWSFVWRDLMRELVRQFRCVTVDAPGCGMSERSDAPATLSGAAAAVGAIIDELDLRDVTLVTHDLGGPAGIGAAAGRTDRIAGLVGVNCFAWRPNGAAFRGVLSFMGSGPVRLTDTATHWLPRITATAFGVGRHWSRQDRAIWRAGIDRGALRAWHQYFADAHRAEPLYRTVEATLRGPLADRPVLTVFGEHNDPLHFQPRWRELFPEARQEVVPGGHHFPMCDDPQLLADAIRNWHG